MKALFLFVGCVVFASGAASILDIIGKGTAKGTFKYKNQACKWYEKRETGSKRSLNIDCKGAHAFKTKYVGDPHHCPWYQKHGKEYYECLKDALVNGGFCANSPATISCQKHKCGDVEFDKVKPDFKLRVEAMFVEEELMDIE